MAVVDHPLGLWPIVSTCLEWEPALAHERREQMRHLSTLADAVAGHGNDTPLVLTADLNAPPDSPKWRRSPRRWSTRGQSPETRRV